MMDSMERFVDYAQGMTFSDAIKKAEENSSTPEGLLKELVLRTAIEVRGRNLDNSEKPLWYPEDVNYNSSSTGYTVRVAYRPESDYLKFLEDVFYKSFEPAASWEYVATLEICKQILPASRVVSSDSI